MKNNNVLKFVILYASFLFFELLGSFSIVFFNSLNFSRNFDAVFLWNFWRILFYGLPIIILYFLLFKYFEKINRAMVFSFFNLLMYVILSILSQLIWGDNTPLPPKGIMFWITCISIFFSPMVLYQINYFKKLMDN